MKNYDKTARVLDWVLFVMCLISVGGNLYRGNWSAACRYGCALLANMCLMMERKRKERD